jgi:hypothetical protein
LPIVPRDNPPYAVRFVETTVDSTVRSLQISSRRRVVTFTGSLNPFFTVPGDEVWDMTWLYAQAGFAGVNAQNSISVGVLNNGIGTIYWSFIPQTILNISAMKLTLGRRWPEVSPAYDEGGTTFRINAPMIPFMLQPGDSLVLQAIGNPATLQGAFMYDRWNAYEVYSELV